MSKLVKETATMSKIHKEKDTGRRDFLKAGTAAILGLGCLTAGLKDALAQATQTGKPLFLPQNLNSFIAKNQVDRVKRLTLASEAKTDLKAFLRRNFHLMPEQELGLASLSKRQLVVIKKAVDRAARGTKVNVEIIGSGPKIASVIYQEGQGVIGSAAQTDEKPTTQPSGGTDIIIGGGCGSIDPKTGTARDCTGTVTIRCPKSSASLK